MHLRTRTLAAAERRAAPPLPDKPSIAVLPFLNLSGDVTQAYFSDGITNDIITELARFRSMFVISRHSSFAYRGESLSVQRMGRTSACITSSKAVVIVRRRQRPAHARAFAAGMHG